MAEDPQQPQGLHIDDDWKAQARAEKEKLAQASKQQAAEGGGEQADPAQGQMPPANFETLVSTFAMNAMFALGGMEDPRTGQRVVQPDLARHHIDMLGVLEEKTKGNLSEEESQMLSMTLYELRQNYIRVLEAARQQAGL